MAYVVNFNTEFLKNYEQEYNNKNADNIIVGHNAAKVCSATNSYKTLQYQPKDRIIVDPAVGFNYEDKAYSNKMNDFIDMSLSGDNTYSLVLTPEYSVPFTTVEHLLNKKDEIEVGTLYCLCCQSTTVRNMEFFLNELSKKDDLEVWNIALRNLESQTLVCCLLYVLKIRFFLKNGNDFEKVFVIPQFKTTPMKDMNMVFESDALSCGKKIIEFGCDDDVRFLSIICADVFNFKLINEIKEILSNNKAFIFNPQLNKRPQNDYFRFMRNMFINYTGEKSVKILTLNWSKGTKYIMPDGKIEDAVDDSWSALYEKFHEPLLNKYLDILDDNAKSGMNIVHDHHVMTYFFSSDEHIIDMNISKFENLSSPEDIQRTIPIKVQKVYCYNEQQGKFIESAKKCCEMIDKFFLNEKEYKELINCEKCLGKCSLSKINEFISSLYYYGKIKNEFEMNNDGKVSSVTSKHYKSDYSREKMYICKRVFSKMKEGKLTKKFSSKNAQFIYKMSDHPAMFNTIFSCGEGSQPCRVIYLKYKTYCEAEAVYNALSKKYEEYAENFIIYYEDAEGMHLFEKNANTTIIKKSVMNSPILAGGDLNEY